MCAGILFNTVKNTVLDLLFGKHTQQIRQRAAFYRRPAAGDHQAFFTKTGDGFGCTVHGAGTAKHCNGHITADMHTTMTPCKKK